MVSTSEQNRPSQERATSKTTSPLCRSARGKYPGIRGVTAKDGSTRAKIERIALQLFVTKGVDAVGIREIASEVGLTVGSLYRHLENKEELVERLFAHQHQRLTHMIETHGRETPDFDQQLARIITSYCQLADEDWELFQFHLLHQHRVLPVLGSSVGDPVGAMVKLVRAAMQSGNIPKDDAEIRTAMALGVVMQVALHKSYHRTAPSLMQISSKLIGAARATFDIPAEV
jgi:AcrR family transcriptional regulator